MYPVGSGILVIIIASMVGIITWKIKKVKIKRQTEEANKEIQRRQKDAMIY